MKQLMELLTLDDPYSSSSADVEDLLGVVPNWRKMELLSTQEFDHGVFHILSFLFDVIVWEIVAPFSKTVISSAIFEHVVSDGRLCGSAA